MNILKLDIIESHLLFLMAIVLGIFLFYPSNNAKISNSVFSTRIFTNIVVGGDIIEPEITVVGPAIPTPIVAPIPTPIMTNYSTNYPTTNSITNTNSINVTNS